MIKQVLVAIIAFAALDFLWLGFVMKDFNLRQLSSIGRIENGKFDPLFLPASLTYILMALAVVFFVLPRTQDTWINTLLWGSLMGFVVFGIFDLTNLAVLRGYPLPFALADIAWGTFVFGVVSVLTRKFGA